MLAVRSQNARTPMLGASMAVALGCALGHVGDGGARTILPL